MGLSTKPLKGMRQLYPDDFRVEKYISDTIINSTSAYGYEQYEAPALEPLGLFLAKSGDELSREQSYNFRDKGNRELILRPELTPSLARMVSDRLELLPKPIKWISSPVCFRYERPQRGRAREFRQFNCDIIGCDSLYAELEMFLVLKRIMKNFNTLPGQFEIRYSSRRIAGEVFEKLGLDSIQIKKAFSVIDKRMKLKDAEWQELIQNTFLDRKISEGLTRFVQCCSPEDIWLEQLLGQSKALDELRFFTSMLENSSVSESVFDTSVVRGLDYYTGIVFELIDTDRKNTRAICGGGRYDNLIGMFGKKQISGVGFGLGLLTLQLFLDTHNLIPDSVRLEPSVDMYIAVFSESERPSVVKLSETLRNAGLRIEMDVTGKNLSKQLSLVNKRNIRFVGIVGPEEIKNTCIQVKDMKRNCQDSVAFPELTDFLKTSIANGTIQENSD